ncbi:MAG: hypothetical protein RIC16_14075 [Rhodospirillales bacterium]
MPLATNSTQPPLSGDPGLFIGRVIEANGRATVSRIESGRRRLHPGDPVFRGDVVETESRSWTTLALNDGTEITLASNGRMSIDRYFFDETNGSGVIDVWMLGGPFYITSGVITGHPNSIIAVRTPNAILKLPPPGGVVAGKFIGQDEVSLFSLLADGFGQTGHAIISTRSHKVMLNRANQTTAVTDYDSCPTRPAILTRLDLFDLFGLFRDRGWRYSGLSTGRLRLVGGDSHSVPERV